MNIGPVPSPSDWDIDSCRSWKASPKSQMLIFLETNGKLAPVFFFTRNSCDFFEAPWKLVKQKTFWGRKDFPPWMHFAWCLGRLQVALPRIYWDVSKEMTRISETRENRNNGNNTIVAISVQQQCMNCVKKRRMRDLALLLITFYWA